MTKNIALSICILMIASFVPAQVCDLILSEDISAPGILGHSIISGSIAYVAADTAGIVRIDITDPLHPTLIDYGATAGAAQSLILEYFDNLLIVADGEAGVGAYSLDAQGQPVEIATTDIGGNIISINGNSGNYLAGSTSGTLYAVALDGNNAPSLQGSVSLGGQILGIVQKSGIAYCALGSGNAIAIVDVSDHSNLVNLGTVDVPGAVLSIERSGNQILAGVEGIGLQLFEIDDQSLNPSENFSLDFTPTAIFMWDNRIHIAAPDFGIAEIDASLGQGLLKIAELPLAGASDLALSGDVLLVSRGDQGFASVDISNCSTGSGSQSTRYIPASARAEGSQNSFWVTDVAVANLTSGIASFNVSYFARGADNSDPLNTSVVLGPGKQMMLNDIFDSLFGLEEGNGALRITTSDNDVKISSRTYNSAGLEGTYGQFIPALTTDEAIEPGVRAALLQLQENDNFRTNIGLVNTTGIAAQVKINLYDGDGNHLGEVPNNQTMLQPFEMDQIGSIFRKVTQATIDSGYAIVTVDTAGAKVLAYASVVDSGSNDPIYIPTQELTIGFGQ